MGTNREVHRGPTGKRILEGGITKAQGSTLGSRARSFPKLPSRLQDFAAVFTVTLKKPYDAAKKRAEPYTKIIEELPQMRHDTVQLADRLYAKANVPMCSSTTAVKGMRR